MARSESLVESFEFAVFVYLVFLIVILVFVCGDLFMCLLVVGFVFRFFVLYLVFALYIVTLFWVCFRVWLINGLGVRRCQSVLG